MASGANEYEVLLRQAQEVIRQQQEKLEELTKLPAKAASVVSIKDGKVLLSSGGVVELGTMKLKVGDMVQVHPMVGSVVGTLPFDTYGTSGTVTYVDHDNKVWLVSSEQGTQVCTSTRAKVEAGDQVVLDGTGTVIMLKQAARAKHAFTDATGVTWDDIGGLEEAKLALRESVEMPYTHAALYKHFGKKPTKGVLLHGLPGNGKTLLGKATVTAIAKAHGKHIEEGAFIYVKGPELLSKWVGETEQMIRTMFEQARKFEHEHHYPAVIFVDEADALLTARGARTAGGMEHTVVPQFLSEMDGLEASGAIVLLATNRADMLDSAVTRPGRIDRKVYVSPPDLNATIRIFIIHMQSLPVSEANLSGYAANALFSDKWPLYQLRTSKGNMEFHMRHTVSGAMVAGLVEQASAKAIHRCIAAKQAKGQVCKTDVDDALDAIYGEHLRLSHRLELEDFAERHSLRIESVARIQGAAQAG